MALLSILTIVLAIVQIINIVALLDMSSRIEDMENILWRKWDEE